MCSCFMHVHVLKIFCSFDMQSNIVRRSGEIARKSLVKNHMDEMRPGDRVVLHSLRKHSDLNGRMAVVCVDDVIDGKHLLQLEDSVQSIRASKRNFTKLLLAPHCDLESVDLESQTNGRAEVSAFGDCILCLKIDCATRCAVPCGHLVSCDSCAARLRLHGKCPLCRKDIRDLLRVYLHHEGARSVEHAAGI